MTITLELYPAEISALLFAAHNATVLVDLDPERGRIVKVIQLVNNSPSYLQADELLEKLMVAYKQSKNEG